MTSRFFRNATVIVACMSLAPLGLNEARASGFGRVLGIGLGAAVIGAIAGQALAHRGYHQPVVRARRPVNPAEANSTIQKALTALGFYNGPISGKIDSATKSSIATFQGKLGDKPTGNLTSVQRQVLLANYAQNLRSAAPAVSPTGPSDPSKPATIMALVAAGSGSAALAAKAAPGAYPAAPSSAAAASMPAPMVPFFGTVCDESVAQDNVASPTILPASALKLTPSQYCRARVAALLESSNALTRSGATDIAVARTECVNFADSMKALVAASATSPAAAMGQRLTKQFAGTAPNPALDNMKVCLGIGYADEQPDLVLASALGIVGMGEGGYGELIAGVYGIGVPKYDNRQRAGEWLDFAADQVEKGAPPVVADLGAERAGILRLAAKEARTDRSRPQMASIEVRDNKAPVLSTAARVEAATAASPVSSPVPPAPVAPAPIATAPVDPRQAVIAQAASFFEKEGVDQKAKLAALSSVLNLSDDQIAQRCDLLNESADRSEGLDPGMALRLCRAWSYAKGDGPAMYVFDTRLAQSGDADAQTRLPLHMIAGHDKAPAQATH